MEREPRASAAWTRLRLGLTLARGVEVAAACTVGCAVGEHLQPCRVGMSGRRWFEVSASRGYRNSRETIIYLKALTAGKQRRCAS